jgi:polyhydroxybutyrate depolymerase
MYITRSLTQNLIAMKTKFIFISILLLITITLPGYLLAQDCKGEYQLKTIEVDGDTREYMLYIPDGQPETSKWPVVLAFHGFTSNYNQMISGSMMYLVADTAKFLIVYPQGLLVQDLVLGGTFTGWYVPGVYLAAHDDILFVDKIIDDLISDSGVDVDAHRIHATGVSNGGEFSYYLACALEERIASVGGIAAQMSLMMIDSICDPLRQVSVLHMLGTADPVFPAGGDEWFPTLEGAAEYWAAEDNCDNIPTDSELPDIDPDDGSTVTLLDYENCDDYFEVLCYRIEGGKHCWPGGASPCNGDINSTIELWNFFKRNPHPDAYQCLENGFYFTSQNQVDNFQSDHRYCEEIMGDVEISGNDITNLDGFENIQLIDGDLKILNNPNLESVSGFGHLETINGDFEVGSNGSFVNFSGLENLKTIDGDLKIYNNAALSILTGLDSITPESINDLIIASNENLAYCHIESICYYLYNGPYGSVTIQDNKPDSDCSNATRLQQSCPPPVTVNEQGFESLISINPNPFTTSTTIEYELTKPQTITITFFNQFGKMVDRIEQKQPAGKQQVVWSPVLPGGVYYFRMEAGEQQASGKVVLVR